jgi:hypothetical protein
MTCKLVSIHDLTGMIGIFSQTTDMASSQVPIPTVKYILNSYELSPDEML